MKILKLLLILFFIFSFNHLKAENEDMKNKITKNLRCLICQGQSVYDSDSEFANSLKFLVNKKINEGLTEKQIYKYFTDKYGEWILYDPTLNKNTYILWLLPLLIFLIGGAGQFARVKLNVEPLEPGKGREVENKIKGGAIPKEFIPEIGRASCRERV